MAQKVDLKRDLKHLYNPTDRDFTVIEIPPMNFLMVDGQGDPTSAPAFNEAIQTLYGLSYSLKFTSKKELDRDYTVMPLEGLWWTGDAGALDLEARGEWSWTLMIVQPEWITAGMVEDARAEARRKKGLPALDRLRFERFDEGLCVQIMHVGPYSAEGPTLARMHHEFIPANGLEMAGKHHEIYLSDPQRVDPSKQRTVLRQPVRRAR